MISVGIHSGREGGIDKSPSTVGPSAISTCTACGLGTYRNVSLQAATRESTSVPCMSAESKACQQQVKLTRLTDALRCSEMTCVPCHGKYNNVTGGTTAEACKPFRAGTYRYSANNSFYLLY